MLKEFAVNKIKLKDVCKTDKIKLTITEDKYNIWKIVYIIGKIIL